MTGLPNYGNHWGGYNSEPTQFTEGGRALIDGATTQDRHVTSKEVRRLWKEGSREKLKRIMGGGRKLIEGGAVAAN